jgi:hypothetical protein
MQRPFKKQRLIGPLFASVSNDDIASKDPEELFQKMRLRSHSYRNYEPEEFFYLAESDEIDNQELLDEMKIIEGGRLVPMLDEVYAFFIPLDLDERRTFNERNPDLMAWVEAYIQHIRGLDQ